MRTRVKICGITRVEDALAACDAGADAIGLVFYPKSSRFLSIEKAEEISRALPPLVSTVALFLNADQREVEAVIECVPLSILQFHGTETAEECSRYQFPYIKAIGMVGNQQVDKIIAGHTKACGFLLDGHVHGAAGGTGESFNWQDAARESKQSLILAGGLKPENVAQAIETAHPWGVDLSSGVESAPGIKDHKKIHQLMNEVRRVDSRN